MIESAMLFALGFFVSGLLWLALSVALVRRARRLTERRLLASLSTRRAEFEAERDELRARHAVQMHRLEREVSRVLDMATAHRLEADIKERDFANARAELAAREEDFAELQQNLATQRETLGDLERRYAEAGAVLRATQHALKMEHGRRTASEAALDQMELRAEQQLKEFASLRTENATLRAAMSSPEQQPVDNARLPRVPLSVVPSAPGAEGAPPGSVVSLPMRGRASAGGSPEQIAALVADAARDLQRLAGEAHADFGKPAWRTPANVEITSMPSASGLPEPDVATSADTNPVPAEAATAPPKEAEEAADEENAESRFLEALAEIRALKRAASQAGE